MLRPRWRRPIRGALDRFDRSIARLVGRRHVLVYVRTAMHAGVLAPVSRLLERDPRLHIRYVSEQEAAQPAIDQAVGRHLPWVGRRETKWLRIDLFVSADPWAPPEMRRCLARLNFFHGVAGKYDLDNPSALPIGFEEYDRVAFVNEDRLRRYVANGIVRRDAAVLVGFPKADALVTGEMDGAGMRKQIGLEPGRPTAIYAPTWSPASSLHVGGEAIVRSLFDAGWNIIVRPHARSLDPDPQYSAGIDWHRRLRALEAPGRIVLSLEADASPLLAASDLMVTDHSTIAFEFCLLDRPILVFDAPDLPRVARINPERIAALRRAARVVHRTEEVGTAAKEEMVDRARLSAARRALAREFFFEPGTATARAVALVYELLHLRPFAAERSSPLPVEPPALGQPETHAAFLGK